MVLKRKNLLIIFTVIILILSVSFSSLASETEKLSERKNGLMSVSYRGDTSLYPENSLEGILSAKEKGADMVSVGVKKTSDGIYVLTENKKLSLTTDAPYESVSDLTYDELQKYYLYDNTATLTEYRMVSLSQAIDVVGEDLILILDIDWEEKDGIYELISHYDAFERIFIRTKETAKTVEKWLDTKEKNVGVIAVYDGNIIFNAISHFNLMTEKEMPLVQFQSKNYFGVIFDSFFCKRLYNSNAPAAIASMYDPDLSGQRSDSQEGWNELIEEGYSVIETNNIVSLVSYIDRTEKMEKALYSLTEKAKNIDTSLYSQTLRENLNDAVAEGLSALTRGTSLDEIESAYSAILLSMNELNISAAEDFQKGQLNITAGKIIAAVLVGAVILAAQIFVHKMQEEKSRK